MVKQFTTHTVKLLNDMFQLIQCYERGEISLAWSVRQMEWIVNAFSEDMKDFILEWQAHWGELEEISALGIEKRKRKDILRAIENLKILIRDYVEIL